MPKPARLVEQAGQFMPNGFDYRKGRQINLFVFDKTAKSLTVNAPNTKVVSVVTGQNKAVSVQQTGGILTLTTALADGPIRVYRITTR